MRHSLLPALLAARKRNQDAGNNRCDLYELAAVHRPAPDQHLPAETIMLSLSTDGNFQHLRGVIEVLATALDKGAIINCNATPLTWAAPGTGAALEINDRIIGHAGLAGPKVKEVFDLQADVCLAEIDFAELHKLQGRTYQLQPLLRFPPITRDLSLVLKESIPWADIESTIQQQKIEDLRTVEFVHIYRGKGIPHTHKSLTLSMNFRNDEETLTHRQVDQYQQRILDAPRPKIRRPTQNLTHLLHLVGLTEYRHHSSHSCQSRNLDLPYAMLFQTLSRYALSLHNVSLARQDSFPQLLPDQNRFFPKANQPCFPIKTMLHYVL